MDPSVVLKNEAHNYIGGENLNPDAPSPAPSYMSFRSDQSMNQPIVFKDGAQSYWDRSKIAHCYAGAKDVPCDICTGMKLKAVKSCLTCSVSYCETHVRQHYTVPALQRHTLVEAFDLLHKEERESQEDKKLTARVAELEATLKKRDAQAKRLCKRFEVHYNDFSSDVIELAAVSRQLSLGMLYDNNTNSFLQDILMLDEETITSMKLSLPRSQKYVKVLEGDSMLERFRALDISPELQHDVKTGLREVSGAAAFLNHPVQSEHQDRVTVHCRTTTRLDMISQRLLQKAVTPSMINTTTATHVIIAVIYGAQTFFVFNCKCTSHKKSTGMGDIIKKMTSSFFAENIVSDLNDTEKAYTLLYTCNLYTDVGDYESPVSFDKAVEIYGSLPMLLGSKGERAVPLKVWLYPLKKLEKISVCAALSGVSEHLMNRAENILEHLKKQISMCQDMITDYINITVIMWFPALKDKLVQFSDLLQEYRSDFQRGIKEITVFIQTKEEEGEKRLRHFLESHDHSPFSAENTDHWLENKETELQILNDCRAAGITIVKSQAELQQVINHPQTTRVMCLTLTSPDAEDSFLTALRQYTESNHIMSHDSLPFKPASINQKVLIDVQVFIAAKEANEDTEQTKFIAASVPDDGFTEYSVQFYHAGKIMSKNVKLRTKPDLHKISQIKHTSVSLKLNQSQDKSIERYVVEYRAVTEVEVKRANWKQIFSDATVHRKTFINMSDLKPDTQYQLRYLFIAKGYMSNFSRIINFKTALAERPGQPSVHKLNRDTLRVSWLKAESDEVCPVLQYMVEYKEAGLEGWSSVLTQGPQCECTLTVSHSSCYRVRVSAVYEDVTSKPSEETDVPVDVWSIDLSKRKSSILLEVLKIQTKKKPVKLRDWTDEESEVRGFIQCLPYISQLSFSKTQTESYNLWEKRKRLFILNLCLRAAVDDQKNIKTTVETLLSSVNYDKLDFLLDLCSHVKDYETQTGRSVLPALQPIYQSAPAVWSINFSKRKSSILLEVLKLQTEKKPVELRGWSDEESEVRGFIQCLPYISKLSIDVFAVKDDRKSAAQFLLNLTVEAAKCDTTTGENFIQLLTSVCSDLSFLLSEDYYYNYEYRIEQSDFLLNLWSHVKDYETQTGRSVLPALQPIYQSAPAVWSINLSERKSSILLEVLKLQTEKKPVELRGWTDEESEVRGFIQCLPYISKLSIDDFALCHERESAVQFLLNLTVEAAKCDTTTGENFIQLLTSVCSDLSFLLSEDYYYNYEYRIEQSDFLLDLCSHVKDYETQTGRSVLPALQPIYQSAPAVWIINLSERKSSILLEVLKLQTEKKPVELRDWTDEESEVRGFIQCLPYISKLRFEDIFFNNEKKKSAVQFLVNLIVSASECDTNTGENYTELLTSVCSYTTFPFNQDYDDCEIQTEHCDFLLDLCSHVKDYETQTGRSVLPALQPIYQSGPAVWIINLSERKSSILLEVLKLQTEKKPVELRDWTDEESEVRGFIQCLPYISELRNAEQYFPSLCEVFGSRVKADQVTPLLQALNFTVTLSGKLPSSTCRSVGRVLAISSSQLNLTLNTQTISHRGISLLFKHIRHLQKLSLEEYMVVKMARALRSFNGPFPLIVEELKLDMRNSKTPTQNLPRILSSLTSLMGLLTVECLDLTECKIEVLSLTVLMGLQRLQSVRFSEETLQQLVSVVFEAQDDGLTRSFLEKVSDDLISCSLTWEQIHYLLQNRAVNFKIDFRKSKIKSENIRELLPLLDRFQLKRLTSSFLLSIMMEIYETRSSQYVSSLLSSAENYINLNSRVLNAVHCAALRFTLEHCNTVTLNLLWTSIPEKELERLLPYLNRVKELSVDRLLLMKMLHCCSSSDLQQEAAALLLSALNNRLDFSCCSALDLTDTQENQDKITLTTKDCRTISSVLQRSDSVVQLVLQDCEISDTALKQLLPILPQVQLSCSKALLLQFLACISDGTERGSLRWTKGLSQALGRELDLSHTQMDQRACEQLALFLEYSEGLSELDLSHCKLTDQCMKTLMPHLHKTNTLDLSHNDITDESVKIIYDLVSTHDSIQTVRLFQNKITDRKPFIRDKRFELW